jgi:hypothetical protein
MTSHIEQLIPILTKLRNLSAIVIRPKWEYEVIKLYMWTFEPCVTAPFYLLDIAVTYRQLLRHSSDPGQFAQAI